MKVILAGLPKCGTKTMVAAFEALGYEVCDVVENYEWFGDDWVKIFERGGTAEDFRRMYENIDVVTDTPMCHFWEEILEAFPDVKIILTQRRNEHEWVKSMSNQFAANSTPLLKLLMMLSPSCRKFTQWMDKLSVATCSTRIVRPWIGSSYINEMICRQRYRQHNNYVLTKAPRDQLLVYEFKQGWEPLCKFLDKPIPDQPFPHENKKGGVTEKFLKQKPLFLKMQNEMYFAAAMLFAVIFGIFSYLLYTFW